MQRGQSTLERIIGAAVILGTFTWQRNLRPKPRGVISNGLRLAPVAEERKMLGTLELLEREPFLHTLSSLLAEASAGNGRLVMIGGEAGVGKTSLIDRFCRESRQSARLLQGACDPLTTPRPLGPLVDIAGTLGGELEDLVRSGTSRNDVFESFLKELARAESPTFSFSKTCTGPTRQRSTWCASWVVGCPPRTRFY